MTNLAQATRNPLAAGSAQVTGTSALSITIEAELAPVAESASETGGETTPAAGDHAEHRAEAGESTEPRAGGSDEYVRASAQEPVASTETAYENPLAMIEQASHSLKAALDEAGSGVTRFSFSLFEFAQANAKNSLDLARDCISVRSLPDILDVQTAYIRRQFDLLTSQVEALHTLTAEMAAKTAAPFKAQANRPVWRA